MPEPLRVLYCVPIGERGGVERFLEDVIVRHDPDRVKPAVLAFAAGGWLAELAARGVTVYCLEGMHMRQPWRVFRKVDEILKKEQIDMVHSAYSWCHGLSSPAAVWNGCKRIWFHHGPMSSSTWQGAMPLFPADLVLVNSNFLGQMLKRTLYVAKKTAVMPYGIEASRLQPDSARRAAFRKQWGLGEQDVAVGIVGFIDHWKGQDVFLEAVRNLRDRAPRLRAFVVGGPRGGVVAEVCQQFQDKLKNFVKEHGLENVVAFTGHVDVREGALDGLDIFVHASTQPEPFGMVILEAMAKGKAIIASAAGGPCEILTDGADGILTPPSQPEALAESIQKLLSDATLREALGRNAQLRVASHFSAEAAARRLEQHYAEIMQ